MNRFEQAIRRRDWDGLDADDIRVLQANLGLRCNLQCAGRGFMDQVGVGKTQQERIHFRLPGTR